jgi:murein DD-endopeptidase MepM/ murein hydrolase activator NlpD
VRRLGLLALLLWPTPALALVGTLYLSPPAVDPGGVTLLTWEGEAPTEAVARCNGRLYRFDPAPGRAVALIGTDLELAPGRYPLLVELTDAAGSTQTFRIRLEVRPARRAEERLTLPPAMVTPTDPVVRRRIERERRLLADLFSRTGTPSLWQLFARPVDDPVGSPFGLRRILNGQPRSPHSGVDFRSPPGTPVRAPARGRVAFAGDLYYTGLTVILEHGAGLFSLYGHLQAIDCAVGQLLVSGEVLGATGSTGRATGPHLHWGMRLQGDRIDPLALVEVLGGGEKR